MLMRIIMLSHPFKVKASLENVCIALKFAIPFWQANEVLTQRRGGSLSHINLPNKESANFSFSSHKHLGPQDQGRYLLWAVTFILLSDYANSPHYL